MNDCGTQTYWILIMRSNISRIQGSTRLLCLFGKGELLYSCDLQSAAQAYTYRQPSLVSSSCSYREPCHSILVICLNSSYYLPFSIANVEVTRTNGREANIIAIGFFSFLLFSSRYYSFHAIHICGE